MDGVAINEMAASRGIQVPQLSPDGYRLERGKFCRLNGRAYLHLVYRDASGELSMFLSPGEGSHAPIRKVDSSGEHVAAFETVRFRAIVVTDQSTESAVRMAHAAERAM